MIEFRNCEMELWNRKKAQQQQNFQKIGRMQKVIKQLKKLKIPNKLYYSDDAFIRLNILQSKILRYNNKQTISLIIQINKIYLWKINHSQINHFIHKIHQFVNHVGFCSILAKCIKQFIILFDHHPSAKIIFIYYLTKCSNYLSKNHLLSYLQQVINMINKNLQIFDTYALKCCIQFCRITQNQFDFSLIFQRCIQYLQNKLNKQLTSQQIEHNIQKFDIINKKMIKFTNQQQNDLFQCLILVYSIGSIKCIKLADRKQYRSKLKKLISILTQNDYQFNSNQLAIISKPTQYQDINVNGKGFPCSKILTNQKNINLQSTIKINRLPPINFKKKNLFYNNCKENILHIQNNNETAAKTKKEASNKSQKNSLHQSKQARNSKLRVVSKSFHLQIEGKKENKLIKQKGKDQVMIMNNKPNAIDNLPQTKHDFTQTQNLTLKQNFYQKNEQTKHSKKLLDSRKSLNNEFQSDNQFLEDKNCQINTFQEQVESNLSNFSHNRFDLNKLQPNEDQLITKQWLYSVAQSDKLLPKFRKAKTIPLHDQVVKTLVNQYIDKQIYRITEENNRQDQQITSMLSLILKCSSIRNNENNQLAKIKNESHSQNFNQLGLLSTNQQSPSLYHNSRQSIIKIQDQSQKQFSQICQSNNQKFSNFIDSISQISQIIEQQQQNKNNHRNLTPYYETSLMALNDGKIGSIRKYKITFFIRSAKKSNEIAQILGYFNYENSTIQQSQSILVFALPFTILQNVNTVSLIIKNPKNYHVLDNKQLKYKKIIIYGVWNKCIQNHARIHANSKQCINIQYILFQFFHENGTFDAQIILYKSTSQSKNSTKALQQIELTNGKHHHQNQRNIGKISMTKIDTNCWYKLQCSVQQLIGANIAITDKGLIDVNENPDLQDITKIIAL